MVASWARAVTPMASSAAASMVLMMFHGVSACALLRRWSRVSVQPHRPAGHPLFEGPLRSNPFMPQLRSVWPGALSSANSSAARRSRRPAAARRPCAPFIATQQLLIPDRTPVLAFAQHVGQRLHRPGRVESLA